MIGMRTRRRGVARTTGLAVAGALLAPMIGGVASLIHPVGVTVGQHLYFARLWPSEDLHSFICMASCGGIPQGYSHESGPEISLTYIRVGDRAYEFGWCDPVQ